MIRGLKRKKILVATLYILFIACLPILLCTTTVRCSVNSINLYEYGFDKYNVGQVTALDNTQLNEIANRLINFFNFKVDTPQMNVTNIYGEEIKLFHDYELIHLNDVRRLFRSDFLMQEITLGYIIIYILLFSLWIKGRWPDLAKGVRRGCALTLALVAAISIASLFFFEQMFIQFHLVVFPNSYWLLDPSKDYLIMLFPEGFWVGVAYLGVGAIIAEALLLGSLAWAVPFIWRKRHSQ
jgi:integral membrane protein (TIGR01906 family)